MAVVKLTCGDCGSVLTPVDTTCPQCGSAVTMPEPGGGGRVCPSCGHRNSHGGSFCETCGTGLASIGHREGGKDPAASLHKKAAGKKREKTGSTLLSRTNIPVFILALGLGGWFLYEELGRPDGGPARPESVSRQSGGMNTGTSEIDVQQRFVDANPGDYAALLKLANLLQDHSSHNPELLPRAIKTYRQYLEANPSAENPRVDLGICYFESARVDTPNASQFISMALNEMEAVIKNNPRHQAAAFNLGIVSLNAGLAAASTEWFRKAAEIDPQSDLGQRAQRMLEQHTFAEPIN